MEYSKWKLEKTFNKKGELLEYYRNRTKEFTININYNMTETELEIRKYKVLAGDLKCNGYV